MKFEKYGYKERKIKTREMNIAELKIGVAQYCAEKNYNFAKVRLINLTCGEVYVFDTPKDFVLSEMIDSWEITLLSYKTCFIYNEELESSELTLIIVTEDAEDIINLEEWEG